MCEVDIRMKFRHCNKLSIKIQISFRITIFLQGDRPGFSKCWGLGLNDWERQAHNINTSGILVVFIFIALNAEVLTFYFIRCTVTFKLRPCDFLSSFLIDYYRWKVTYCLNDYCNATVAIINVLCGDLLASVIHSEAVQILFYV